MRGEEESMDVGVLANQARIGMEDNFCLAVTPLGHQEDHC